MKRFKWKRAIIVFCIVMALNLALLWANHASIENIPSFVYVLVEIMDWPGELLFLTFALLFDVSSFQGVAGFGSLVSYGMGPFSALVWAVLVGFIFRRESITKI